METTILMDFRYISDISRRKQYEEIREKALLQGISDNKVSIGMWASLKGYIKTRKQIKKKVYTMYYAPQSQPN